MKIDAQLKTDVTRELEWDPAIHATHVGVAVDAGVVTLTGHLETFAEKDAIERAVQRVEGVRAVAVELDVKLAPSHRRSDSEIAAAAVALSACNKAPDAPPAAPPAPTTMGTQIDDAGVTGRVKAALLAAPDVKSADISVLTVQGEVQLSGILDNQAQIDQVVQIARAADGVTGVKNELRIKQ